MWRCSIWTSNPSDVKDEEYEALYKTLTNDWEGPLTKTHFKVHPTRHHTTHPAVRPPNPALHTTPHLRRLPSFLLCAVGLVELPAQPLSLLLRCRSHAGDFDLCCSSPPLLCGAEWRARLSSPASSSLRVGRLASLTASHRCTAVTSTDPPLTVLSSTPPCPSLCARAPFDVFQTEKKKQSNLRLYVRRVFVTDDCKDFCPEYLSFLKGLVDSEDLPLNISRESLQVNRILAIVRKHVVKKAIDSFVQLQDDEERYRTFYDQFSKNLKLGVHEDSSNRARLAELLRFFSSHSPDKWTTLKEYVQRMKEGQKGIYYLTGESKEHVARSPFLEGLQKRGLEVLFLTDPIDEVRPHTTHHPLYTPLHWLPLIHRTLPTPLLLHSLHSVHGAAAGQWPHTQSSSLLTEDARRLPPLLAVALRLAVSPAPSLCLLVVCAQKVSRAPLSTQSRRAQSRRTWTAALAAAARRRLRLTEPLC